MEAEESLQVLGRTCISMLAAVFHLYFKAWEHRLGIPVDNSLRSVFKHKGWLNGYNAYFARHFHIRFEDSPIDLCVLEDIVLVRNRAQHSELITMDTVYYSDTDLKKLPHPFFIDEREACLFSDTEEGERTLLIAPPIRVTAEKLSFALSEVEKFSEWLENTDIGNHASRPRMPNQKLY